MLGAVHSIRIALSERRGHIDRRELLVFAAQLGMAVVSHREAVQRSSNSSRDGPTKRLGALAARHPELNAAQVRRKVEAELGRKIDAGTARAVVRRARMANPLG